jgi:hypothetical protein
MGATAMRTRLSDDFVLAVKDQLRTVRYKIRRGARGVRPFAGPADPSAAADAMFSQVEAAAAAFLPKDEVALYAFPFPQGVSAYFALDPAQAPALSPKIFSALKALLNRFGSDIFLVSEHAVHEACEAVQSRQAKLIAAALDPKASAAERFDASVRLCGVLAAALVAAHPVRELMTAGDKRAAPRDPFLAPNEYCAFVIGLAIALSSRADVVGLDRASLVEAADLAVYARFGEMMAALKAPHPAAALATQFGDLLRFLP